MTAPFVASPRKKTTVAAGTGTAVCTSSTCGSRNCCTYYCKAGETCVIFAPNKPICLVPDPANPGGFLPIPNFPTVCYEDRCSTCTVSSLSCGANSCAGFSTNPALTLCNFDAIRGPLPAPVAG